MSYPNMPTWRYLWSTETICYSIGSISDDFYIAKIAIIPQHPPNTSLSLCPQPSFGAVCA